MVKDRKQAGRQGFNDKATMACRTGTIVELAIILGHRSSAYLSQQFNIGAIRTLNIIFTGLYGFMLIVACVWMKRAMSSLATIFCTSTAAT